MYYESDLVLLDANPKTYTLTDLGAANRDSIVIQPQIFTNDTQAVLFRFDAAPTLSANDVMLSHGDTAWLVIRGYTDLRFRLVNKTTGVDVAGGTDDRVMVRGAEGQQVT